MLHVDAQRAHQIAEVAVTTGTRQRLKDSRGRLAFVR
jgi:hypothetical protein